MSPTLSKSANVVARIAALVAAVILGQTLYFKFTGQPESIYIFEKLGAEPWGRYGSGAVELVAVLLLLSPRTAAVGALLAMGTMAGAIASHLGPLGIDVQGDGGTLFALAVVTFVCAATVAFLRRRSLPIVGPRLAR
ncbi:MAG: DoxX family protein [Planctomycetota bacterium]